jgi:hypothetical protein
VRESLKNYRRYLANHDSAMASAVLRQLMDTLRASTAEAVCVYERSRATGKQILHGVVTRDSIEKFTLDRL